MTCPRAAAHFAQASTQPCRSKKFQVRSRVRPRPDFFKVTTSRFEFLKSRSEPRVSRLRTKNF